VNGDTGHRMEAIVTAFESRRAVLAGGALALLVTAAAMADGRMAHANGAQTHPAAEAPTRFERLVLSSCSPCVRESYPVATLTVAPVKLPAFPRAATAQTTRPVEVSVEVLRAYPLGQPSRRLLALRIGAFVATGTAGQVYRLVDGVLDDEEVDGLVAAIGEISRLVQASPPDAGADTMDADFHGGSLRVGAIRLRSETVAYIQGGDIPAIGLRPVWEVPTTVYLPVTDLPSLAKALGEAAAKILTLRGAR